MQNPFFNVMASFGAATHDTGGVQFWDAPDRSGWLMKQGDVIKTWRSRFFVLKDGKLFWFSGEDVTSSSTIRGVIDVRKCLSVKGAEDVMNREARAAIHGDVYLGVQAAINPTMVGIIAHVVEEGVLVLDQVEDIGEEINGSFEYYLLCHSYCMYFMSFNGDRSVRSV